MYPNARSPLDAYDWHTSDGVPAGGHDSHSPSLQTSLGSHLTKFKPCRESGRISEMDLVDAKTASEARLHPWEATPFSMR
jgi:hypothetical protein